MIRRRKIGARAFWYGPLTSALVARRCGFASAGAVRMFWQREQAAGRLPAGPRPFFADCSPKSAPAARPSVATVAVPSDPGAAVDAAADRALDRLIERNEVALDAASPFAFTAASDPLLKQLRKVHGHDRRRKFVLRVPDDRKEAGLRDAQQALRLARRHDAAMTAFAAKAVQEVA